MDFCLNSIPVCIVGVLSRRSANFVIDGVKLLNEVSAVLHLHSPGLGTIDCTEQFSVLGPFILKSSEVRQL